jgi:hypothetical protein
MPRKARKAQLLRILRKNTQKKNLIELSTATKKPDTRVSPRALMSPRKTD